MEDVTGIPRIPSPMAPQDPLVLEEDNLGKKQICVSNDEFMDEKENVSAGNALVVPRETPMMPMSKRKAKGFNLRKSLAWNKAFFTEEGVLDPMEMSTLTGSVTKASGSFQPGAKGAMSPLTRFNVSSERSRPVLQDLGDTVCDTGSAKPSVKDVKDVKAGKVSSIHREELEIDAVSVKKSPQKGLLRTVLQSPFLSSQKRVANTCRTNPASKIPKVIHTKTSLPLAFKSSTMGTKGSKCNQSIVVDKDVGSSSTSDKDSDGFKMTMVEKASDTSKINQDPFFQRKIHEPITSKGFRKPASSVQNNDHRICGGLPAGSAVAHAKPSGLRMPTPTMGFFSQGKVSPKYNSQPQKVAQPFISKIPPPRKFTNEKPLGESRPTTTQKLKTPTVTTKSTSAHVASSRSQAISAQNCSKPSTAALGRQPAMKLRVRMLSPHDVDREGAFSSGSSNCPTNQVPVQMEVADGRIANPSLETSFSGNARDANQLIENHSEHEISCSNFSTQVHNSSKLQESDLNQQQACDSVELKLRILPPHDVDRERTFSFGSSNCPTNQEPEQMEVADSRIVNPSLEASFSGNVREANQLIENYGEHEISCSNFSTQVHNLSKLQESDLNQQQACDSVNIENPEVQDSKDGSFSVTVEDKHTVGTVGNPTCELACGFTTNRDDHGASMVVESSLRLNVESMAESNDISSNLNLDLSSSQGIGIPVKSLVQETSYQTGVAAHRDDAVIPHLQERKHSAGATSDILPLKKPINAVPFSDEWLAAVESYGEGILEQKTGPVQNSPPEKVLSEPGPWSPVKRKAQEIGPYDCTKYSKDLSTSETN
ncbi:Sirtuin catalytic core small domain-containing protein [Dioscorea alata]|uniref:Sirtuin catalytic core small domain-containing protein n=1 Tax=Dioscorea alata TaxID=55571 RepID=A0ACB7U987_DIOAL|nr:Sirtuin catalytic core small domain-containing protein [Dioscorea alata]